MNTETKRPLDIDHDIDHDTELNKAHYQLLAGAVAKAIDDDDPESLAIDAGSQFVSTTRDDLTSFDGSSWREASGRQDFEIDGHPVIHWDEAQVDKGQQRCSITIIDLGGIRLCYQA